jgi:hypothetical protein
MRDFPWGGVAIGFVIGLYLVRRAQQRAFMQGWERNARRLGLEPGGSASAPSLRGTYRGATIELVHAASPLTHRIVINGAVAREGKGRLEPVRLQSLLDELVAD